MDGIDDPRRMVENAGAIPAADPEATGRSLRAIFVGNDSLLAECANLWIARGYSIVAVVAANGPAAAWCDATGTTRITRLADVDTHSLGSVDYLFSITNLRVLPTALIAMPRMAAINFHDGPLPDYAGLNTPVWALLAGEAMHGVTWHCMTNEIDAGDIVEQEPIAIEAGETALSLNMKCFEAGLRSFARLADRLTGGTLRRVVQRDPVRRWFARDQRPDMAATIDWAQAAETIARMVTALDHGSYRNPLGAPKALVDETLVLVQQLEILTTRSGQEPGSVVAAGATPIIATATNDVRILHFTDCDGKILAQWPGMVGAVLHVPGGEQRIALNALDAAAATYENWWGRHLSARDPLLLPVFRAADQGTTRYTVEQSATPALPPNQVLAALITLLGRTADRGKISVGYGDPVHSTRIGSLRPWFADELPLQVELDWTAPLSAVQNALTLEIAALHRRVGVPRDLIARSPDLRNQSFAHPVSIRLVDQLADARFDARTVIGVAIEASTGRLAWNYDPTRVDAGAVRDLQSAYKALTGDAVAFSDKPICDLALMSNVDLGELNAVSTGPDSPFDADCGIHSLFAAQAARTPDKAAVTSRGISLTYSELDARSSRLAWHLAGLGVGPDTLVGLHLERSVDLVVAILGIHKAGGAYVPLDPAYPADRLAHMISDSGLTAIVTQHSLARELPTTGARIIELDGDAGLIQAMSDAGFDGGAGEANLAYVIYTSGSTGKPKGVMVEHRNVANFFAGMDERLDDDGVWLAVTSPSFDISVLELCWPLTRGYHVVIATEREVRGDVAPSQPAVNDARSLRFSLFYFASAANDGTSNADQYRLLLEGAKFADTHGFEAVWTPERHFHEFGGLYPNPSVISAAIAVSTSRVQIRAGSCVAPLHHPARIAEEWALVDNLSNGRVGIAFASGWQPNDFLLRPDNFADKNAALMQTVGDVRALWRGEKRSFPGPLGTPVEIGVFPSPVQTELPFWITSAGNPETFAAAGRAGANLLTHLLGQSVAEVAVKLDAYRRAWREAGHPSDGHVTMMLHSFVGDDADEVRRIARGPMIEYLRTSTSLLKQYAWSFPAFRRPEGADAAEQPDLASLSPEETDALLEHAFERYFDTAGLFGTPEKCVDLVHQLAAVGVDEIGCLIDFGIATQTVLDQLPQLDMLRRLATAPRATSTEQPLHKLIARHKVTHLQCTPSLVQMLATDRASREALRGLKRLMVGGEPFPVSLAEDMTQLVGGTVMNMYGPTETTIWSAVQSLETNSSGPPPLGTPLANQQLHVVDSRMRPVRPGTPGELLIGGAGVVRGYHARPELTADRFVLDPFKDGRAYRTGDVVRRSSSGRIEFLGRVDHQIKIRGYRVELGEIESALQEYPQIREAVVVARHEGGVARLIAYYVSDETIANDALRTSMARNLPDFMIPSTFVSLPVMPRTPNGKIDRAGLPDPTVTPVAIETSRTTDTPLQAQIAAIWRDVLKVPSVGLHDNFFDLGGHSLLVVQAHRRLVEIVESPVSLTDLFRFPTVEALSAHLGNGPSAGNRVDTGGRDRARSRRLAMQRRAYGGANVTVGG
ncbi:MupA/Atu3671 family FMN-dependent luciferase-like monooxygenase [Sphingomonas sp. AX6]|uniref:MupA/Atu3671 family FMN-dependent luciferase-like monooxygenase n=1 Tax=Sphingomonas sp. AX6 TaxID=2653171 RepID=UPI0012F3AEDD|nr:MupA/Atu3671 family FMN-dependent luciferase-like monooxygenase [Sphingomonas sp. AX6]VXC98792.1 putative L-aminoadipate-semialdehyde dehydrogenase [Sphingomonas sp. AX6]